MDNRVIRMLMNAVAPLATLGSQRFARDGFSPRAGTNFKREKSRDDFVSRGDGKCNPPNVYSGIKKRMRYMNRGL